MINFRKVLTCFSLCVVFAGSSSADTFSSFKYASGFVSESAHGLYSKGADVLVRCENVYSDIDSVSKVVRDGVAYVACPAAELALDVGVSIPKAVYNFVNKRLPTTEKIISTTYEQTLPVLG